MRNIWRSLRRRFGCLEIGSIDWAVVQVGPILSMAHIQAHTTQKFLLVVYFTDPNRLIFLYFHFIDYYEIL